VKQVFDYTYKVRGLRKTDDWVGWTDGYSIIVGVNIPFILENNSVIAPITAKDASDVLGDFHAPYVDGIPIAFVKTPIATGILQGSRITDFARRDYFDIWVKFGLQRVYHMTFFPDMHLIGIYDMNLEFRGFFHVFNNKTWIKYCTKVHAQSGVERNVDVAGLPATLF